LHWMLFKLRRWLRSIIAFFVQSVHRLFYLSIIYVNYYLYTRIEVSKLQLITAPIDMIISIALSVESQMKGYVLLDLKHSLFGKEFTTRSCQMRDHKS